MAEVWYVLHSHSLTDVLNRCRQAVLGAGKPHAELVGVTHQGDYSEPPRPTVRPYKPFADCDAVQGPRKLSKGAARLWELLHSLGRQKAIESHYSPFASQVVFPLPQSLAAAALGYTDRHVRNLQVELEQAGLLDSHALADCVQGRNLWSTTLWCVKLTTRSTTPRLRPEDFQADWRDFELDLQRKNTAQSMISGLKNLEESKRIFVLFQVIVTGIFSLKARYSSFTPEMSLGSVQDAVYRLGDLADSPRVEDVAALAGAFATGFHDQHSFRWWCAQLWRVVGSWERVGALQAKLQRVLADLSEYDGIRNPASWASSRLSLST